MKTTKAAYAAVALTSATLLAFIGGSSTSFASQNSMGGGLERELQLGVIDEYNADHRSSVVNPFDLSMESDLMTAVWGRNFDPNIPK